MPQPPARLRLGGVLGATLLAGAALASVAPAPLVALARGAATGGPVPPEHVVAAACAATLVGCYALWVLGLVLALAEAVAGVRCPPVARRLSATVLTAALGASVAVAPAASADPADARPGRAGTTPTGSGLAGLALPDRVMTALPSPRATAPAASATGRTGGRTHVVVAGDSLWRVAARALPPGAGDAVVDRAWRRLAAANREVVRDPDLIFPGTSLHVPPLDQLLGKDQP